MYGLGIRIGFYLQWYSGDLASWFAPSEVQGIRLTNSVFIAATFLALLIQIGRNISNLQVVEVYIILLVTFGYYLFLVPLYVWRILTGYNSAFDPTRWHQVWSGEVYSVLNFLLLVAVASFHLWFWFHRVPQLDGQACQQYGFFFAKIRLNRKGFEILNLLFYFLLLSCCAIMLFTTVLIKANLVVERRTRQPGYSVSPRQYGIPCLNGTDISSRPTQIESLQKLRSACNVAVASTVIAGTELTIKWNKIQGVNSLTSAGQTIPLLIGIATILRIAYVRISEGPPTWDDSGRWEGPMPLEMMPEGAMPAARFADVPRGPMHIGRFAVYEEDHRPPEI